MKQDNKLVISLIHFPSLTSLEQNVDDEGFIKPDFNYFCLTWLHSTPLTNQKLSQSLTVSSLNVFYTSILFSNGHKQIHKTLTVFWFFSFYGYGILLGSINSHDPVLIQCIYQIFHLQITIYSALYRIPLLKNLWRKSTQSSSLFRN